LIGAGGAYRALDEREKVLRREISVRRKELARIRLDKIKLRAATGLRKLSKWAGKSGQKRGEKLQER
jgi:hypothetical protein